MLVPISTFTYLEIFIRARDLSFRPVIVQVLLCVNKETRQMYLFLTEFEVRTVSYGPSFFPLIHGPSAKRAGHKSTGKKRGSVTYSTDRENEVIKMSVITVWLIRRAGKERKLV